MNKVFFVRILGFTEPLGIGKPYLPGTPGKGAYEYTIWILMVNLIISFQISLNQK